MKNKNKILNFRQSGINQQNSQTNVILITLDAFNYEIFKNVLEDVE